MVFLLMLLMKTGPFSWDIIKSMDQGANLYGINKWKVMENGRKSVMVMGTADVLLHTWFESGDEVRKDTGFVGRREKLNEIWGNWIIREA